LKDIFNVFLQIDIQVGKLYIMLKMAWLLQQHVVTSRSSRTEVNIATFW